jgi:hypothetical protein
MKIEQILYTHLAALGIVFGLWMLFPVHAGTIAAHIALPKLTQAYDPALVLRTLLFLMANVVLVLLAPVICLRGIRGADVAAVKRFSWFGVFGGNVVLCLSWVALLVLPLQPPAWMTCALGVALQVLIQINAYKLNFTDPRSPSSSEQRWAFRP